MKRRRHLLRSIMPKSSNNLDSSSTKSRNEQRHQDLNFIKSIESLVVAEEIDRYPEWNITRF